VKEKVYTWIVMIMTKGIVGIKVWKQEIIFIFGLGLSYLILLTIGSTYYWGLIGCFIFLVLVSSYYVVAFFKEPRWGALYFYIAVLPFLIGYFALIYKSFGVVPPWSDIEENLSWFDAYYFSVVTWTTLGYGDFIPGENTRIWAMVEAITGYLYMGILVGKIMLLGQKRQG